MEADIGEGIKGLVHRHAQEVAGRHGAREGQHQIGAFGNAVLAQGNAEIIFVAGDTDLAGDIDQPADADGGIDHDTARGIDGLVAVALQHIVGQNHGRIQVGQGIVDAIAHRLRHHAAIAFGHGAGHRMVDPEVEIENVTVGFFPGIVLGKRFRAGRAAGTQKKAQRKGRHHRKRDFHARPNTKR